MNVNIPTFLILGLACLGLGYGLGQAQSPTSTPLVKQCASPQNNSSTQVTPIEAIAPALNTKLSVEKIEHKNSLNEAAKPLAESSAKTPSPAEAELYQLKSHIFAEAVENRFAHRSLDEVNQQLNAEFMSQAVDEAWATEQETSLGLLFRDKNELAELALREIHCKSTLCQVAIATSDDTHANAVVTQFSQILYQSEKPTYFLAAPDSQNNITYVYLTRDGKAFESNY